MTASQSSAVILNSRLSRVIPALFTNTVGAPSSSATRPTAVSTACSSATSAPTASASPPDALISSTTGVQAEPGRCVGVGLSVVDEDHAIGPYVEQVQRVREDVGIRFAHAHLTGDDDQVEHGVDVIARVGVAPAVGEQRHPDLSL